MFFAFLAAILLDGSPGLTLWPLIIDPNTHIHKWKRIHITRVAPVSVDHFKGSPQTLQKLIEAGKGETCICLMCECGEIKTVKMAGE